MAGDKTSTNDFPSYQQPDFYKGQGNLNMGSPPHTTTCMGLWTSVWGTLPGSLGSRQLEEAFRKGPEAELEGKVGKGGKQEKRNLQKRKQQD